MDKALLVGINAYPGAPLRGCLNDIADMAAFIVSACGFPKQNVRLLADQRATTSAIVERLHWLVDGAQAGDRLFFHYSGHGAQMSTRDHQGEVDGLDEVICPVDFDWTDEHVIRDKDFHRIFSAVPSGCEFVWVSDSCHSGDLSRGIPPPNVTPRQYPVPTDVAWRNEAAREKGLQPLGMRRAAQAALEVGLISGCRSDETSADAVFDGRPNGALTYFLLAALQEEGGRSTALDKLVVDVASRLEVGHYSQVPGIEGAPEIIGRAFLKKA